MIERGLDPGSLNPETTPIIIMLYWSLCGCIYNLVFLSSFQDSMGSCSLRMHLSTLPMKTNSPYLVCFIAIYFTANSTSNWPLSNEAHHLIRDSHTLLSLYFQHSLRISYLSYAFCVIKNVISNVEKLEKL